MRWQRSLRRPASNTVNRPHGPAPMIRMSVWIMMGAKVLTQQQRSRGVQSYSPIKIVGFVEGCKCTPHKRLMASMAVTSGAAFLSADSTPPFRVMLIMEQSAQAPSARRAPQVVRDFHQANVAPVRFEVGTEFIQGGLNALLQVGVAMNQTSLPSCFSKLATTARNAAAASPLVWSAAGRPASPASRMV